MNPYTTWRSSSDHLDLSNSTNGSSTLNGSSLNGSSLVSQSLESLLSDQSLSSALGNSGFDIASLIQNASFLNSQHRSVSAPAAYRIQRNGVNMPPVQPTQRLPPDYSTHGLTPPPSPNTIFKRQEFEELLPSPKRQNSQPSPTMFEAFRGVLPTSSLAQPVPTTLVNSGAFTKPGNLPTNTNQSSEGNGDHLDIPERTSSGKRKRIEDDYVMIEPINKTENTVQQEMRELFESIVETRADLHALKSTPSLTKRKEKSRLNSALDRKIKRFKEMRLQFLESVLTMEHTTLRNVLDKAVAELQFCKCKGIPETMSDGLALQIDNVMEQSISGDIKGFFAKSIGICDTAAIEEE